MSDLFSAPDPLQEGYSHVYQQLTELREAFHRSGRLDDSNAKLDEVSKLFATYLAFKSGQIGAFPHADEPDLISKLQSAFSAAASLPQYRPPAGNSIFGPQPSLAVRPGEEGLANDLVRLVRSSVDFAFGLRVGGHSFDVLNEAFGHFVRDNFRSNIEDAQYMTPPEVVDFMTAMVLEDIALEDSTARDPKKNWTVLDPTCGVGSFLAAVYHRAQRSEWLNPRHLRLLGQDKVERMVRLSTINLQLFNVDQHRITVGNSLQRGSGLDALNGSVDIILTNPPFGARFDAKYVVAECGDNTPFFSGLRRAPATIDSELLFIDRDLRLLRDGGRLLIVVPDGVVSAKGVPALLRQHLGRVATLRAVIELPPVTFAQAGTRTKTAVLYLQKGRSARNVPVFFGVATDLGFQVSSRKGVQIKVPGGDNELPAILERYHRRERVQPSSLTQVLSAEPSCVLVPEAVVLEGSWIPNHYSAARFEAVAALRADPDLELVPLCSMVDFFSDARRAEAWRPGCAYISVLHILGEGFVDVGGALSYAPKTPGVPTSPGEVLVSRINPRIPRVCVVPDLGVRTLCSSEFEVMRTKPGVDNYEVAYLLQTAAVQRQICSLASGTSASHNRVRSEELGGVLVPVPKPGTKKAEALKEMTRDYRAALLTLSSSAASVAAVRAKEAEIFP